MKPRKVILTIEATTDLPLATLRTASRVICDGGKWLVRWPNGANPFTEPDDSHIDQVTVQVVQPAKPAKARRKGSK